MRKLATTFIYVMKILVVLSIATSCIFLISSIAYSALNKGNTNIEELARNSFALLFAFAALFFSWARGVREDEQAFSQKILKLGETCFFTSIIFLIASVLKFYEDNSARIFDDGNFIVQGLVSITKIIFPLLFLSGFTCTFLVLYKVLIIMNNRFFKS